jgi:hypothetical protein
MGIKNPSYMMFSWIVCRYFKAYQAHEAGKKTKKEIKIRKEA